MNIRNAEVGDSKAIRQLTIAAYREHAQTLSADNWDAYRTSILTALDSVGDAEQIVAEQAGAVVGSVLLYANGAAFAYLESNDDFPEVRLLAVVPSARGSGIGAALMDECVRRVRNLGSKVLALHTMETMRTAKRLYARMGFVRTPELDFVPREGILAEGYCLELDT